MWLTLKITITDFVMQVTAVIKSKSDLSRFSTTLQTTQVFQCRSKFYPKHTVKYEVGT